MKKNFWLLFSLLFTYTILTGQVYKTKNDMVKSFIKSDSLHKFLQHKKFKPVDSFIVLIDSQKLLKNYRFKNDTWGKYQVKIIDSKLLIDSIQKASGYGYHWVDFGNLFFIFLSGKYMVLELPGHGRACVYEFKKTKKSYKIIKKSFYDGI